MHLRHTRTHGSLISKLDTDYRQVQAEIRTSSPRHASLTQPRPIMTREIQQQLLDPDTLLLEYALGKEKSYLNICRMKSVLRRADSTSS